MEKKLKLVRDVDSQENCLFLGLKEVFKPKCLFCGEIIDLEKTFFVCKSENNSINENKFICWNCEFLKPRACPNYVYTALRPTHQHIPINKVVRGE